MGTRGGETQDMGSTGLTLLPHRTPSNGEGGGCALEASRDTETGEDRRPPGRCPFRDPRRSRELGQPWRFSELGRPWRVKELGRPWRVRSLRQPWRIRGLRRPWRNRSLWRPWRISSLWRPWRIRGLRRPWRNRSLWRPWRIRGPRRIRLWGRGPSPRPGLYGWSPTTPPPQFPWEK